MAQLLERGLHAMSMDEVARQAGVGKATIYRWWPSKERLALDALSQPSGQPRRRSANETRAACVRTC